LIFIKFERLRRVKKISPNSFFISESFLFLIASFNSLISSSNFLKISSVLSHLKPCSLTTFVILSVPIVGGKFLIFKFKFLLIEDFIWGASFSKFFIFPQICCDYCNDSLSFFLKIYGCLLIIFLFRFFITSFSSNSFFS